jgi:hypothetical protein
MSPRRAGRTQDCSAAEAEKRLEHAKQFLFVSELAAENQKQDGGLEYANAAATLAVLAGIAAADAACCKALRRRSRADDHHAAEDLIGEIAPDGKQAASKLRGLIDLKSDAQYGFYNVTASELTRALRQAKALIAFADRVLTRV